MIALDETQLLNQFGGRRTKFKGVTGGEVVSKNVVTSQLISPGLGSWNLEPLIRGISDYQSQPLKDF